MSVRTLRFPLVLFLGIAISSGVAVAEARVEQQATIVTVAGSGIDGHTGDGGPALAAAIAHPRGIAFLRDGSFVFAEPFANTVRRVAPDGTITTIAGTGETGYSGDGGLATAARLFLAHGVAQLPDGSLLVADAGNNRIRRIADGIITTVAGTGAHGFSGDGGPAVLARIANPRGVAALPDGGFLIPDTDNDRVRRVFPDGTIRTVAGTGTPGFSGDGSSALAAEFRSPFGVVPIADGGFLVVDAGDSRIRRVSRDGTIATVAGTGVNGFSGDDGRATSAEIDQPHNVAVLPDGGFMIADTFNNRVRRVWPDGTITTVAADGAPGFSGDGGDPLAARLNLPKALAVLPDRSGFLVADSLNNRVRLVRFARDLPPTVVAANLRRTRIDQKQGYALSLRACDDSRASLVAQVVVRVQGVSTTTTSSITRRLVSTAGGCRPYRISWHGRAPVPPGRITARVRVRDARGAWSNAVVSSA
jgi:sugar lactone lactonase YvrE